jgi:serine/threonine-protein kinase
MGNVVVENDIIPFIRQRDYQFIKWLGRGACGVTALLYDDLINENIVCKKYSPVEGLDDEVLFANFIREVKILYKVYHHNIVRVYNCYLYPTKSLGYILMEYIEGTDIDSFISKQPEMINELFIQAVVGFSYLEKNKILHRDIRPQNILIRKDGLLKIIDFGFGKTILKSKDFNKSICLNWCFETPQEFSSGGVYDFKTEVYFLGKLFERAVINNKIEQFKYVDMLSDMCQKDPSLRFGSFVEVETKLLKDKFSGIDFSEDEIQDYQEFSDLLATFTVRIEKNAMYIDSFDTLEAKLGGVYRSVMLEKTVPNAGIVIECFILGTFRYKVKGFTVSILKNFWLLLKSVSIEKKRIIMANIHTKLDSVSRYEEQQFDDVPF